MIRDGASLNGRSGGTAHQADPYTGGSVKVDPPWIALDDVARRVPSEGAENEQALTAVRARALGAIEPGVKRKKAKVGLPRDLQGETWNGSGRHAAPRALAGSSGMRLR